MTYVFLIRIFEDVLAIRDIFDEIAPTTPEGRIAIIARHRATFETKVGVYRENECVQEPDTNNMISSGVSRHIMDILGFLGRIFQTVRKIDARMGACGTPNAKLA